MKGRVTSRVLAALVAAATASAEPLPELDCLIQPRALIAVASPVEAVIESVEVDRGDAVEKGDVIARLESSVEKAAVAVARERARAKADRKRGEVRLAFADRSLARSTELERRAALSTRDLDEAETEKRLAEVEIQLAEESRKLARMEQRRAQAVLDRRTIKSPVDGVVVERILSPGEYADPPQIAEIAEIDPLHVEVFAPVDLLGRIRPGMTGRVMPEGPSSRSLKAKVTVVDPVVDAASGTFGVRLELPNPEHAIPAGLRCRVTLEADPGSAR